MYINVTYLEKFSTEYIVVTDILLFHDVYVEISLTHCTVHNYNFIY